PPLLFLRRSNSSWTGYSGGSTNPRPVVAGRVQEVLRPPAEPEPAAESEPAGSGESASAEASESEPAESEEPASVEASESELGGSEETASAEASESEPAEFELETQEPIMRLKLKRK